MPLRNLRVVFFGMDSLFTLAILRAVQRRCRIVGIVEAPRRSYVPPHGMDGYSSHLLDFARRRRLPHFLLTRRGPRATEFLEQLHPDVGCVASFAQRLLPEEFQLPSLGTINLHPSALPQYRGPNPYFWQHHQLDLDGAVTIHYIDAGLDTGDILLQEHFPIALGATFLDVYHRTVQLGPAAMVRALELLSSGQATPRPQRHLPCPVYARFVSPQENLVDWENWPIERTWHFLRGTHHECPCLPSPSGNAGTWIIGPMERGATSSASGVVARDHHGYHVAHREGRIRLRLVPQPSQARRFLLDHARRVRRALQWW